jgi:sugar phosphate isomerase/epimerase
MEQSAKARFEAVLSRHVDAQAGVPTLDAPSAAKLLERTANVPFFGHSYTFYHNMIHGFTPHDLARFAYEHDLHGICLHISDGNSLNVRRMMPSERDGFRRLLEELGLQLHLEISSTDKQEVDTVIECARSLGVRNIRFYARHEGPLSSVITKVFADLAYACDRANKYDLHFDYEQHEDLRAAEIAGILARLDDPRMNALFDYSNSLNAYEDPLAALHILAPYVRQVHIKGARKIIEGDGWGQLGVPQGAADDELPGARMLYDLLKLGDRKPQVICFALEQEVDYYAPAFRRASDPLDPVIQYREPSDTPVDRTKSRERLLSDERRWAVQQIGWNRDLVALFREHARAVAGAAGSPDVPAIAKLPQAAYGNAV